MNNLKEKIKYIRELEKLTQQAFCDLTDIPRSTISSLERSKNKTVGTNIISKICNHPRFTRYTAFLILDNPSFSALDEMYLFLEALEKSDYENE